MVASQRTAVTGIIHIFPGKGRIRNTRGMVTIRNRQGLEEKADNSYRWMR